MSAPTWAATANHAPHLDRLAAQGQRYTAAFTPCPVCSPARSGVFTGMYPVSIDAHHHRSHRGRLDMLGAESLPDDVHTVMTHLRHAGYHTAFHGGKHLGSGDELDLNFPHGPLFDSHDWNDRREAQPFFAYTGLFHPHRTFVKPDEVSHPVDPADATPPPPYPDVPGMRRD